MFPERREHEMALEQEEGHPRTLVGGDAGGLECAGQREKESGAVQGTHSGSLLKRPFEPLLSLYLYVCTCPCALYFGSLSSKINRLI